MYYFQAKFKDTDDIYIIRIRIMSVAGLGDAKRKARKIIKETILNEEDFEIKELTLEDLVSQFHFVNDIAQLSIIRNP